MSIKKIILIIFFFAALTLQSQERKALFGIIKDSLQVLNNAHIVNLNSNLGTVTIKDGSFKIYAKIGDTLRISTIQHQEKKYPIIKSSFSFKGLVITLKTKVYELDEIELKRNNLFGRLDVDLNYVPKKQTPDINAITLGLPNAGLKKMRKIDREIYTATTSSSGISLDLILNILSGRLKKLKKRKKIIEEDEDIIMMFKKFKHSFAQNFNIKDEDAFKFLYFCEADSLFNKTLLNDELNLIVFLQKKSKKFNEKKIAK